MSSPFVSIIIPTFNVDEKIEASLRSLTEHQAPFENLEVLIIDGASTDNTIQIARDFATRESRIQVWSEPDAGIYDAMNKGITHARGEFLYFLGAGDTVRPGVFVELQQLPGLHPRLLLHGQVWNPGANVAPGAGAGITKFDLARYNIPHQGAFYGREVFAIVGLYEPKYRVCADYELNWRCWTNPRIETRFWNRVVADFELGGVSSAGQDAEFQRDWPAHLWRRGGPKAWLAFQISRRTSPAHMNVLRALKRKLRPRPFVDERFVDESAARK